MGELEIDPNKPKLHAQREQASLERDRFALNHGEEDADPQPVRDTTPPDARQVNLASLNNAPARPPSFERAQPKVKEYSEPVAAAAQAEHAPQAEPTQAAKAASAHIHPLIVSLISTLPTPHEAWSLEDRVYWLRAAEDIFHLLYRADGRARIQGEAD